MSDDGPVYTWLDAIQRGGATGREALVALERTHVIDLHIHLLPAIDDGAASIEVSAEMLRRARELGFQTLVATPHLPEPMDEVGWRRVRDAHEQVRQLGQELGVDVRLGFEAMLTPDLPARLANGEPSTLGGSRAILVELPFAFWPHHAETTLFNLQTAGYRPVLAHPERYSELQRSLDLALSLAERGIVLQATIGSYAGLFGRTARRLAEDLLRRGAIGVVASDAHSAGQRYMVVDRGLDRLRSLVGQERLKELIETAPAALLDDAPLPPPKAIDGLPESSGWSGALRRAFRLKGDG